MSLRLALTSLGIAAALCHADHPAMPEPRDGDLSIDVGSHAATNWLGFGWSRGERVGRSDQGFQWMTHLEADVWFDAKEGVTHELWLRGAPLYLPNRRQNVGVYVNGSFVTEWVCPDSDSFSLYHARLPGEWVVAGRNRLILRAGYRKRVGLDKRELSFGVERILLRPVAE